MRNTREQLLESLRVYQYEAALNATNKEQLKYMLQLIQACEAKGAVDSSRVSDSSSMLTAEEIRVIKSAIIDKLES